MQQRSFGLLDLAAQALRIYWDPVVEHGLTVLMDLGAVVPRRATFEVVLQVVTQERVHDPSDLERAFGTENRQAHRCGAGPALEGTRL